MWKSDKVLIKPKVKAEHLPCSEDYFKKYLKSKPLTIVYASKSNNYIRVRDQKGEEWGLFKGQFVVDTQVAIKGTDSAP